MRAVRARGVRAPERVRFPLREPPPARDHADRPPLRAGHPEHHRRRLPHRRGGLHRLRQRGRTRRPQPAHPGGRPGRAASQPGDGRQDGRGTHRQRPRHLLPPPAHRPHDQHLHGDRRDALRPDAGRDRGRHLCRRHVGRADERGDVHLQLRGSIPHPGRPDRGEAARRGPDRERIPDAAEH